MKLSVLMPVYNERSTLDDILDRVLASSLPAGLDLEIVAVDDGSIDGSREILAKRAVTEPRIRVFEHEHNAGKSDAIQTAIREATGDIGIMQDADLEYNPSDYGRLLKPILDNEADVVYGSRFAAAEYRRVLMFWHTVANRFLTALSNMMTDLNLTDMETGYKAFRMSILKTIPIRSRGFGMEPEITAKIAKRRLRIFETPVTYNGRTYLEGKKLGLKDAFQAVWVILKYRFIDDLYNEQYGAETLHSMEHATRFTQWLMDRVRPYLSGTVLEVGAGIGNNARAMLDQDMVIATECNPEYVALLNNMFSRRRRVRVMQWDATTTPPELPVVNTVFCSNVLEHIENDTAALQNMHAILEPGGALVLVVPAGKKRFGSIDRALDHHRRYSGPELIRQLEDIGFESTDSFSMNKAGVAGWFVNCRILHRKSLSRVQLKLFNVLVPVFRIIDPILPWTGLSLVVVAKKPSRQEQLPG